MFSSYGYVEVDTALRIRVENDFILYYRSLFNSYTYNTVPNQLPTYKAHISIILPDIHKNVDISPLLGYNNLKVDFQYNPENIIITKKNVWMVVDCLWAENIKKEMGIVERDFWGFHIVICNFKFNKVKG